MNLYICGPMSGIPDYNFPSFDAAADLLTGQGYTVFNPAENDRVNGFDFIGLEGHEAKSLGFDLRATLKQDLGWICDHADGLALLPGAHNSKGATAEIALAVALGIPVHPVLDWVYTSEDILV